MCIRDSGISGVSAAALLLQEGAEVVLYDGNDRLDAAGIKEQIEGQAKGSAVSYTHLDVYKRQGIQCGSRFCESAGNPGQSNE